MKSTPRVQAAPDWVVELCQRKKHRPTANKDPLTDLDTDSSIAKTVDYLKNHAPKAIAFEGGNDTTYRVAAKVREFGVSENVAFDLISEHWNEAGRAEPPWDPTELQGIIGHAFAYATGAWGGALGVTEFGDASEFLEAEKKTKRGLYRVRYAEAAASALEQIGTPLVDDVLNAGAMGVMYGASGSGKTFLSLDMSFHIAAGLPWHGRAVVQGPVLYVAAEGGRGIFKRIAALQQHFGVQNAPLDTVPCPINLLSSKADMKELLALIDDAKGEHGVPVSLIVIDTLSRALAGGEENASTDMGAFVQNMDRLRDHTGATVLIVHHSGKDAARGARGHSLLRAATDTEIEIGDGMLRVTKQRDLDPIPEMRFKLDSLTVGKAESGKPITSCTVRILKKNDFVQLPLTDVEEAAFAIFKECWAGLKDENTGVRAGIWDEKMVESGVSGLDVSTRTLQKVRKGLEDTGWVRKNTKNQYFMAAPEASETPENTP